MSIISIFVLQFVFADSNEINLDKQYEINYIVDTVLDSSFNDYVGQNNEFDLNKYYLEQNLSKSNILSIQEAKILIDRHGTEIRLLQLEKELYLKEIELKCIIDSNLTNSSILVNKSNLIYYYNRDNLKFRLYSLNKLRTEINLKNISSLENYDLIRYYLESKYQYNLLAIPSNNISNMCFKNNSFSELENLNILDLEIDEKIDNYNSFMLKTYLRKLGINDVSLINDVSEGKIDKNYINQTLREELQDMESFEIQIISYRLNYKEKLDYEEIISLYDELNLYIDNSKIFNLVFNS